MRGKKSMKREKGTAKGRDRGKEERLRLDKILI